MKERMSVTGAVCVVIRQPRLHRHRQLQRQLQLQLQRHRLWPAPPDISSPGSCQPS